MILYRALYSKGATAQQNDMCAQRRLRSAWVSAQSLLTTWRSLGPLATHWAHSEDSNQTKRMPRLISVLAGLIGLFCWFVMLWLRSVLLHYKFQCHLQFGSSLKKIFKGFTIYGHDSHLGHMTRPLWINFHYPIPGDYLWNLAWALWEKILSFVYIIIKVHEP